MKKIRYIELGATLFIPASHKHLEEVLSAKKYPSLKSLVIDFEDGLEESDFDVAMHKIESLLKNIVQNSPLVFMRAKSTKHLQLLLELESINKIDGFVLAKFSLENAQEYLEILKKSKHYIMPSVEGEELFHHNKLHELKELITTHKEKVLLVRFGLEDMLKQLRMRRECSKSIFDFAATAAVLGNFIATFKSAGFSVSGGVYPCFKDKEGFIKDVKRDLKEGLFSKTIIHPKQIEIVNELYKVTKTELLEAKEILSTEKKVFNQNGKMAETLTMSKHSQEILKRSEIYGVRE